MCFNEVKYASSKLKVHNDENVYMVSRGLPIFVPCVFVVLPSIKFWSAQTYVEGVLLYPTWKALCLGIASGLFVLWHLDKSSGCNVWRRSAIALLWKRRLFCRLLAYCQRVRMCVCVFFPGFASYIQNITWVCLNKFSFPHPSPPRFAWNGGDITGNEIRIPLRCVNMSHAWANETACKTGSDTRRWDQ